jgi:hypothetical protein
MRVLMVGIAMMPNATARGRVLISFADVAEQAIPGVVNIRTTQYTPNKDPALDLYHFFLFPATAALQRPIDIAIKGSLA